MRIKEKHKIVVFLFSVLILIISLFSYWTLKKEQIKIIVNDKVIITSSFKKNIKDLLDEKGIKYDNNDKITPNLNDELKDYMEINIVNVDIKEKKEYEKDWMDGGGRIIGADRRSGNRNHDRPGSGNPGKPPGVRQQPARLSECRKCRHRRQPQLL